MKKIEIGDNLTFILVIILILFGSSILAHFDKGNNEKNTVNTADSSHVR